MSICTLFRIGAAAELWLDGYIVRSRIWTKPNETCPLANAIQVLLIEI